MNSIEEDLMNEFLPRELFRELYFAIPEDHPEKRIAFLKESTQPIRKFFNAHAFKIRYNEQIGFIYWSAGDYALAIPYLEKSLAGFKVSYYPSLYFHVIGLLIRCQRLTKNYNEAFQTSKIAIGVLEMADSAFTSLSILGEYVDLLSDSGKPFKIGNSIILAVIDQLEFPFTITEPIETVNAMRQMNKIWNRKLGEIVLDDDEVSRTKALKQYIKECPLGWYKKYVQKQLKQT